MSRAHDRREEFAGLRYVLREPTGAQKELWPLLLFLHGAGERGVLDGRDLWKVHTHGPWKAPGVECCLVLAPQCPTGFVWPSLAKEVGDLVEHTISRFKIDTSRIYATGLSMGAFGVWATVSTKPRLFTAIVSICGAFSPLLPRDTGLQCMLNRAKNPTTAEEVAEVRHIPAWIFHGDRDKIVEPIGSQSLFEALGGNRRGDALKFNVYHDTGHHCWSKTYSNADVFKWLLLQRSAPVKKFKNYRIRRLDAGPKNIDCCIPPEAATILGLDGEDSESSCSSTETGSDDSTNLRIASCRATGDVNRLPDPRPWFSAMRLSQEQLREVETAGSSVIAQARCLLKLRGQGPGYFCGDGQPSRGDGRGEKRKA